MIRIDRRRKDKDRTIIEPPKRWFDNAARMRDVALKSKSVPTNAKDTYGADSAVVALEELFHGKCAYCKSSTARMDVNIEHYRPKGKVREDQGHPGYYWLAFEWSNLYPSCIACNQTRKARRFRGQRAAASSRGKHDQFPLSDPATRAMSPDDDLARELRLLLDPCADEPEKHLAYDVAGRIFALAASAMGASSINVYVLDAKRLENDRRKQIATVADVLKLLAKARADRDTQAASSANLILDNLTADEQIFAGARRYARRHPEEFGA